MRVKVLNLTGKRCYNSSLSDGALIVVTGGETVKLSSCAFQLCVHQLDASRDTSQVVEPTADATQTFSAQRASLT